MKNRIFNKQWLELKPAHKFSITDNYYLKLANTIKKKITISNKVVFLKYLDEKEFNLMCCFLSAYFEDVISEVNIWKTFVTKHTELYGKKLPFYNTDDYIDNEINHQDVAFLLWYFINSFVEDLTINPFNDFILNTATEVMDILEEEYEIAPANKILKSYYQIKKTEDNYYFIRSISEKILYQTWLFFPDTGIKLKATEEEIIKKEKNDNQILGFLQENRDIRIHLDKTSLLNMKGNEWLAEILGKKHWLYNDILNITPKIKGFFYYKKQDKKYIYLEHIASNKHFKLLKSTYDDYKNLIDEDTILYIGMVKWKKEWWFSGITFTAENRKEIVDEQKNDIFALKEVDFLDYDDPRLSEFLKMQFDAFLKFNNNSPVKFLPSTEVNSFISEYTKFYNKLLNLTKKEQKKADKKMSKKGYSFEKDEKNFSDIADSGLVYFNEKSGIEIALGINSAFPSKENPYFNEEDSTENLILLIFSDNFSKELTLYCINNYKDKLSYFKESPGNLYLKDIDFIMRFYKKENYHSIPSVSLV